MRLFPQSTADFGYLEIFDLYSKKQLDQIWREIAHLKYISDLDLSKVIREESSAVTGGKNSQVKMSGDGVHLDSVYVNREYSAILQHNRKLFTNNNILKSFAKTHPANVVYKEVGSDFTIFNRYKNTQGYLPHKDQSSFTSITVLLQCPEKIKGGDLIFPDYDVTFAAKNNSCVLFPSWVDHCVTPLSCGGDAERYSIANLSHMRI